MDVYFLLLKCFFVIHIVCLHFPPAESSMRLRTGWRREAGWTSILPPPPLTADTGRQMSTPPESRQEYSLSAGGTQEIDMHPWYGDFGGFTRRKDVKRGRARHFGQFNSDTVSANE